MKNIDNRTGDEYASFPLEVSVPIFTIEEIEGRNIPSQIGTGLFLNLKNKYFFVSAEHIFKDYGENIFLPLPDGEFFPTGIKYSLSVKDTIPGSDDDFSDVAFIEVENYSDAKGYYRSIKENEILYKTDYGISEKVLLVGYPHRKFKLDKRNKKARSEAILRNTEIVKNKYSTEINICINYERKKVIINDKHLGTACLPHGISGGGLWKFVEMNEHVKKYMLIGIAIEYREDEECIVCTNINAAIATLYKHISQ